MKDKDGQTALINAAENGHTECVKLLLDFEAGMRDNRGETAMMKLTGKGEIVSFLSPFEAGIADNNGWNQTCHAIDNNRDITAAIRLEKTVGWLQKGKTILEAEIGWRPVSKEQKQKIQ